MFEPAVSVRDLRKRLGTLEVLWTLSLDAYVGDMIPILGASGFAKSALLRGINMGWHGRMEPADGPRSIASGSGWNWCS